MDVQEAINQFEEQHRDKGLGIPRYDPFGRRSISINQNQGAVLYPFDGRCDLGGIVADIGLVLETAPLEDAVYVSIERTSGIKTFNGWESKPFSYYSALSDSALSGLAGTKREHPRLIFTDKEGTVLLDTDTLLLKHSPPVEFNAARAGFWYFCDERGRNSVRYREYTTANGTDMPFLFPQCTSAPVKLVSRCWAACANNVYYVQENNTPAYSNNLQIHVSGGVSAKVSGNTVTFSATKTAESGEHPLLRTINFVGGDRNNNLDLLGDGGCIAVSARMPGFNTSGSHSVSTEPHTIGIRNDCKACCSCESYKEQFEDLNDLIAIHNYEKEFLRYLTDYYEKLLAHYYKTVDARMANMVRLRCAAAPKQVSIGINISNPSGKSVKDVSATLAITGGDDTGETRRVVLRDADINSCTYPTYKFKILELKPHSTWSGLVTVGFKNTGNTIKSTLTVTNLLGCNRTATCEETMSEDIEVCEPKTIIRPPSPTITINLPSPPPKPLMQRERLLLQG